MVQYSHLRSFWYYILVWPKLTEMIDHLTLGPHPTMKQLSFSSPQSLNTRSCIMQRTRGTEMGYLRPKHGWPLLVFWTSRTVSTESWHCIYSNLLSLNTYIIAIFYTDMLIIIELPIGLLCTGEYSWFLESIVPYCFLYFWILADNAGAQKAKNMWQNRKDAWQRKAPPKELPSGSAAGPSPTYRAYKWGKQMAFLEKHDYRAKYVALKKLSCSEYEQMYNLSHCNRL